MQYHATIFAQLLKALPRGRFESIAKCHRQGRRKRSLSDWGHFVAMVFAQASGTRSLRDLERVSERQAGVMTHLGIARIRRTTLADANATRPAALFEDVARELAGGLVGGGSYEAIRLIDATQMFAGRKSDAWTHSGGIKLHMMYDLESTRPVCFAVTPKNVNDITAAHSMPIEPDTTYVFDKGYYSYSFWAKIDAAGSRFVTRLKTYSPVQVLIERSVATIDSAIKRDATVMLNQRLTLSRHNPLDKPLRLITVAISTGREITLISNDLDSTAEDIATLYKKRWQIELFFKWIKQNLKLGHFMGASRNAIIIQIMAALIVYMLLRLAQLKAQTKLGLQAIARLSTNLLLAKRPLTDIFKPPPKPPRTSPLQMNLRFNCG